MIEYTLFNQLYVNILPLGHKFDAIGCCSQINWNLWEFNFFYVRKKFQRVVRFVHVQILLNYFKLHCMEWLIIIASQSLLWYVYIFFYWNCCLLLSNYKHSHSTLLSKSASYDELNEVQWIKNRKRLKQMTVTMMIMKAMTTS